jgi:hypothetical protein
MLRKRFLAFKNCAAGAKVVAVRPQRGKRIDPRRCANGSTSARHLLLTS